MATILFSEGYSLGCPVGAEFVLDMWRDFGVGIREI